MIQGFKSSEMPEAWQCHLRTKPRASMAGWLRTIQSFREQSTDRPYLRWAFNHRTGISGWAEQRMYITLWCLAKPVLRLGVTDSPWIRLVWKLCPKRRDVTKRESNISRKHSGLGAFCDGKCGKCTVGSRVKSDPRVGWVCGGNGRRVGSGNLDFFFI